MSTQEENKFKKRKIDKMHEKINKENHMSINLLPIELMEKIFSYLTLKEAFRYETVCKKWQHIIFNEQEVIDFHDCLSFKYDSHLNEYFPKIPFYNSLKDWLQSILKKCPNIKKIESDLYYMKAEEIQVLIDLCPHLDNIKINYIEDIEEDKDSFHLLIQKYGHQLKRVSFNKFVDVDLIKEFCCSLREMSCFNDILSFWQIVDVPHFRLLNKTCFCVNNQADGIYFRSFAQLYCNQLKCFHLHINVDDEKIIKNSLQEVTKFYQLNYLCIESSATFNGIKKQLIDIARTCIHLKTLQLKIFNFKPNHDFSFYLFSHFQALKELNVFPYMNKYSDLNLENLSNCKHLQKLTLYLNHDYNKLLEDIHLFLPNLTFVRLIGIFSDATLKCLAQLNMLNTIILQENHAKLKNSITDTGVCHLLDSCRSIRRIIFDFKLNITHITISKLMDLISENPGLRFTFVYANDDKINTHEFNLYENRFKKIVSNLHLDECL